MYELSDEQSGFVDAIRAFCQRECGTAEQRARLTDGHTSGHNQTLYDKLAALGWLGVSIPERYGGAGGGVLETCLFLEETALGMAPIAGYHTSVIVAGAIERFGSEEQRREVLGRIARGAVASISMSEPEAGSDVGALRCRAERVNGGYVINGQKTWCSHAHFADDILLVARTDGSGDKHHGLTMLLVGRDAPGLEIRPIATTGASETNDLYFTDCEVPAHAVLGTPDQGWMQLMAGLNIERLAIAAGALGLAQRALDDTLDYVRQRTQFGRPIGRFQAIQHRIADLATELQCSRLLTYSVAAQVDRDPHAVFAREASMAKLKATETAKSITLEGMQMMGAYGQSTEFDMQRHLRVALISTVFGGTNEIQRNIIAKTHGL